MQNLPLARQRPPQRLVRYYQTMQAAFDGRLISGPDLPHEFADPERPSDSND